jgi:hypothetical protein
MTAPSRINDGGLCLRGFRRSALLSSTFRFHDGSVTDQRRRPVPSRLSLLGIVVIDFPLS